MSYLYLIESLLAIAWAAEEEVQVAVNTGAWHAIAAASPVVKLTLLILVIMSVVSWAIMFAKRQQFQSIEKANEGFLKVFTKAKSFDQIDLASQDYPRSLMAQVFKDGYQELSRMAGRKKRDSERPLLSGVDNLERALRKSIDNELTKCENRLGFLATTGSTCPFIGLFGTVWGIMGAFQKIGATGMASLAVVAPGISEALIATAIGLAAAIPATVAYNHFSTRLRSVEVDLNNFSADFINIAKRNFFVDQ